MDKLIIIGYSINLVGFFFETKVAEIFLAPKKITL